MKLNKTIIISDIISIFIAFLLFVWIFIEMKCVAIVYDRILNNLFIKDFNPVQTITLDRNRCQYKNMFPILNYTFPGIPESCYDSDSKTVKKNKCTEQNENLKTIEEIKKTNFTIWRNKIICGNFFQYDKSFYKLKDFDEDKCDDGFKKCGHINLEVEKQKLHKILCVKEDIECPLNFIEITNNPSSYGSSDYNIFSFDNGYFLVTSNKITSNGILTKLKIAEGEYPCYERGKYSNSTIQFPTINNIDNFNCNSGKVDENTKFKNTELRSLDDEEDEEDRLIREGYDVRYTIFDTLPKYTVLIDNDFDYSYSRLPNLTNWNQDMYKGHFHLFRQDAYIIKEECEKIDINESNIIALKKVQAYRVVFALFHIIIYVILFSILGLIKVILAWRHSMLFGIKIGISFIIFGVNYYFIFESIHYIQSLDNFQETLDDCLDEVAKAILHNHDINEIINELKEFYDKEEIFWYIYIFFNFIEACRLVHKIYIRCKNTYRRNIANMEIGADNLKKIFEKVRDELEKQKNRIKEKEKKKNA